MDTQTPPDWQNEDSLEDLDSSDDEKQFMTPFFEKETSEKPIETEHLVSATSSLDHRIDSPALQARFIDENQTQSLQASPRISVEKIKLRDWRSFNVSSEVFPVVPLENSR